MPLTFFLESDSTAPGDDSQVRIYVDGTSLTLREGRDIELSHWNPNTTDECFAADSSTEIALNFVRFRELPANGLVINNHLDVDGVLAAWVLLNPELALQHRERLVEVAEIGDFWNWGSEEALRIYQALVLLIEKDEAAGLPEAQSYRHCFDALQGLLETPPPRELIRELLAADELVRQGHIQRVLLHGRFVSYRIPAAVTQGNLKGALRIDGFNASLNDGVLLPATVRNRKDSERVQLVSVEGKEGWYHDLHYPGYMWAVTVNRWRAPGFWDGENSNTWYFRFAPLEVALDKLRKAERNKGTWQCADELTPFDSVLGRAFPVVASFLDDEDQPTASSQDPDEVAEILLRAFTYDNTNGR